MERASRLLLWVFLGFLLGRYIVVPASAEISLIFGADSSSGAASVIQTDGSNALKVLIK